MNVIVTAGGTSEAWDDVRVLTNRSTGRTGAMIAESCLERGAEVDYIHVQSAQVPIVRSAQFDLTTPDPKIELARLSELHHRWQVVGARLRLVPLSLGTVADYSQALMAALSSSSIDVAFLAMAVSDFAPLRFAGKVDSRAISGPGEEPILRLRRTPKVIRLVRDWSPSTYFVGFKLLSGVKESELITAATRATIENRVNVTVANDFRSVVERRHEILLVRENAETVRLPPGADLTDRLVEQIFTWAEEWHATRQAP